jgi:hypothetical protein
VIFESVHRGLFFHKFALKKCRSVLSFNAIIKFFNHNGSLFNEFVCKLGFFWHEFKSPRIHTGDNSQILTVSKKIVIQTNGRQKIFVCNSLVKYLFFTRRICALASLERQIFLLVKKSFTYFIYLLHK